MDDLENLPDDGLQYELFDDGYHEVTRASGDEVITVEQPYPVRICPTEIAAG